MSAAIWPFYVICWSWSGVGLAVTTPTHHECCYLATLCELLKLVRCGTGGHHSYSTHHECCYLSTLCELLELVRCGAGGHHAAGDGIEGDRPPVVSDHHLVGPAARSGSEHTAGVNNPQRSTSPLLTVEPFAALFVSRYCTCHHLTQPGITQPQYRQHVLTWLCCRDRGERRAQLSKKLY